jgi:aspartate/methionine/tyrosine aminotransferase
VLAGEIFDMLGTEYDHNSAGMFLWGKVAECHFDQAERVGKSPGEIVSDRVLHEAGVFITPGIIFGKNGEQYIRISLCAKPQVLQQAADRIRAMLQCSL